MKMLECLSNKIEAKDPCQSVQETMPMVVTLWPRANKSEDPFKTNLRKWKVKIMNTHSEMLLSIN
jgi:hypothetical protein